MAIESVVDWILASQVRMGIITAVIGGIIVLWLLTPAKKVVISRVRDSFHDRQQHNRSPPLPKESQSVTELKETEEGVMQEARERLEGWFVIKKEGEIELRPQVGDITQLEESLLYIFAARVAYDRGERDTPEVSSSELVRELGSYEQGFLSSKKNKGWIFIHREGNDREQPSVELNRSNADNVAEYICPGSG